LWLAGLAVFGLMAALRTIEVTLLLRGGTIGEVERLTGPRSYVEEAEETLDALGVKAGTLQQSLQPPVEGSLAGAPRPRDRSAP
jgi:hypothetical protein